MSYELEDKLVIGIASSALFDLSESDRIFSEKGEEAYREYQQEHLEDPLEPGVAFPFIKRLLSLNDLGTERNPLVEVIVLSHNSPDTGLRVLQSTKTHELGITRAVFTQGKAPFEYMTAFNMSLFLSANKQDVVQAARAGFPAGQVIGENPCEEADKESNTVNVAFDFDNVLAGSSADDCYEEQGPETYRAIESALAKTPLETGPLAPLLRRLNEIQDKEDQKKLSDPAYERRLRVSIVTARNAPADERVINSLREWELHANDLFFLGGIPKAKVLQVLKPHIFFDDKIDNLEDSADTVPCVYIPASE